MGILLIGLVVGSAGVAAHVLSDMENGHVWHTARWDHIGLALSVPALLLALWLWL